MQAEYFDIEDAFKKYLIEQSEKFFYVENASREERK